MIVDVETIYFLESTLLIFLLSLPRLMTLFLLLPFLSKGALGGVMMRNGVIVSLALFLFPITQQGFPSGEGELTLTYSLIIVVKEIIIGFFMGYCVAILFWSIESVGFFIDNQRGSTMASSMNPLSGEQTSTLGIFLSQAMNTLFFVAGIFTVLMGGIYASYVAWPVFSYYPSFSPGLVMFFLNQLDLLVYLTVLLASPVIIAMFFAEFGLAMIGRFAPQMDVFFLSMPIKSAVAMSMLIVYVAVFMRFFADELYLISDVFQRLGWFI